MGLVVVRHRGPVARVRHAGGSQAERGAGTAAPRATIVSFAGLLGSPRAAAVTSSAGSSRRLLTQVCFVLNHSHARAHAHALTQSSTLKFGQRTRCLCFCTSKLDHNAAFKCCSFLSVLRKFRTLWIKRPPATGYGVNVTHNALRYSGLVQMGCCLFFTHRQYLFYYI